MSIYCFEIEKQSDVLSHVVRSRQNTVHANMPLLPYFTVLLTGSAFEVRRTRFDSSKRQPSWADSLRNNFYMNILLLVAFCLVLGTVARDHPFPTDSQVILYEG